MKNLKVLIVDMKYVIVVYMKKRRKLKYGIYVSHQNVKRRHITLKEY